MSGTKGGVVVWLRAATGECEPIRVAANSTVAELAVLAAATPKFGPSHVLHYGGAPLDTSKRLADCGVGSEAILDCLPAPPPAASPDPQQAASPLNRLASPPRRPPRAPSSPSAPPGRGPLLSPAPSTPEVFTATSDRLRHTQHPPPPPSFQDDRRRYAWGAGSGLVHTPAVRRRTTGLPLMSASRPSPRPRPTAGCLASASERFLLQRYFGKLGLFSDRKRWGYRNGMIRSHSLPPPPPPPPPTGLLVDVVPVVSPPWSGYHSRLLPPRPPPSLPPPP
eukprot:Hpha_TRINITY_DN30494_c0_g1::TRINITY_DN30494_c0_g1_i1::g.168111::m.168111